MKYLMAVAAIALSSNLSLAQCYDSQGRPRTCPNTPVLQQRGIVNLQRNYSSAAVREEIRDVRQPWPVPVQLGRPERFELIDWPEEIIVNGRIWRRAR